MNKRDIMIRKLCEELGKEYIVCRIDLEICIYRDFGNGFNVEISGVHTSKTNRTATLFLWFGDMLTVRCIQNVERSEIGDTVEELYAYTEKLIRDGLNNEKALYEIKRQNQNKKIGEN